MHTLLRTLVFSLFIHFSYQSVCSPSQAYTPSTQVFAGTIRDVWPCAGSPDGTQCGSELNAGEPTPACLIANSGWQCATDFQRYVGDDIGAVAFNLDTTSRIPVLDHGATISISNPAQFAQWYVNSPTFNIPIPVNLTATNDPDVTGVCDPLVFTFNNQNFYPINGEGFGDYWDGRNYAFTFALHVTFSYQGNEVFSFAGDDDVWIFVNDKLALDLGGVHGTEGAALDLTYPSGGCAGVTLPSDPRYCVTRNGAAISFACACLLGIEPGNTYTFDLFYNERHTSGSDLEFTSSLLIQCPFYDHCGVCQGDGQSCCSCPSQGPCFTSKCAVNSSDCIYTFSPSACPYGSCNAPYPFFGQVPSLFNAFTSDDFTCYNSDTQGRLAVGGNADIRDYSVACEALNPTSNGNCVSYGSVTCADIAQAGEYANSLIVGGNLYAVNGQVEVGNVFYGGTFNNDPTFQAGAGCETSNSVPIDFGAAEQYLQALSMSVSDLDVTGTVTNNYGSIVLTGTNSPTMEVFSIDSSVLCNSYGLTITAIQPTAALFINVAGTSASCGQFGMSGYSPNQAVFNFFEATSLSIFNIQWQGSILAPLAAVTNSNGGAIDGQVFVSSVTETNNCIQINWYPFSGCIHD